jgi:hypothetical protein
MRTCCSNGGASIERGKFGAPDPTHMPVPSRPDLPVATSQFDTAMTLLPVQVPAAAADAVAASACIEVIFRSATVRICGAPEMAALRIVLDTLARRS